VVATNPVANDQFDLPPSSAKALVKTIADAGQQDWDALSDLRIKLAHFYKQTHLMNKGPVSQPWVGACDIQLPVEDKYKARMRGGLRSLMGFGGQQHVNVRPGDADSIERSANLESYLNSVLRGDFHVHSQQDFSRVGNLLVESVLQHGFGFLRPDYFYRTEVGFREIRKSDLPGLLPFVHFQPDLTDIERERQQQADQQRGIDSNPPQLVAMFGGEAINPVNREIFDRHKDVFKALVANGFDLDIDDKIELEACDAVMKWMRDGAKESLVVFMRFVTQDHPGLAFVQPHRLLCPPRATSSKDLASAYRVSEIMPLTEDGLRAFGRDMGWADSAVSKAAGSIGSGSAFSNADDDIQRVLEERSGEDRILQDDHPEGDHVDIVRSLFMAKHHSAHVRVEAYIEPESGTLLSYRSLPYNLKSWNYVAFGFEENEEGVYTARGLPETIEEQSKYITATHRAAQNARVVSTSRGYFLDESLGISEDDPFWSPSMVKNVKRPNRLADLRSGIVEIAPQPGAAQEWQGEQFFHTAFVDDHLGESGTLVRDARLLEPITATESNARESQSARVASVRGGIFVDAFSRAVSMMASYAQQFMSAEAPATAGGAVKWLSRDDIRGTHMVRAAAAVGDMSPDFRADRALRRLSTIVQMRASAPEISSDPGFRVSLMNAFRDWIYEDDPEAAARIVEARPAEETQQIIEQSQQQQQQAAAAEALGQEREESEIEKIDAEAAKLRAQAAAEGGDPQQGLEEGADGLA